MPPSTARTMTLTEAAARLGVSPVTLRAQIANKRLKATKRGRDWFVGAAEVDRYERESLGRPGRRQLRSSTRRA